MDVRTISSSHSFDAEPWSGAGGASSGAGGASSVSGGARDANAGARGAGGADGTEAPTSTQSPSGCAAEIVTAAVTCRDAAMTRRLDKAIACVVAADAAVACLVEQFQPK